MYFLSVGRIRARCVNGRIFTASYGSGVGGRTSQCCDVKNVFIINTAIRIRRRTFDIVKRIFEVGIRPFTYYARDGEAFETNPTISEN